MLRCTLLILSVMTLACGGEDAGVGPGTGGIGGQVGWASTRVQFQEIRYFSGFDGQNQYIVPLGFLGDVTLNQQDIQVQNPAVAQVQQVIQIGSRPPLPADANLQAVLIRTTGPGQTAIVANYAGQPFAASLTVMPYQPGGVQQGQQQYQQICGQCHGANVLGEHSTAFLADLDDTQIIATAIQGQAIRRLNYQGQDTVYTPNNGQHSFPQAQAAAPQIVQYLRSRPPTADLPQEL